VPSKRALAKDCFRTEVAMEKITNRGETTDDEVINRLMFEEKLSIGQARERLEEIRNGLYKYLPIYPLYEKGFDREGMPPTDVWSFTPKPYKFHNKNGTITGVDLYKSSSFEIKPTD
jgi:hypothetical protein